MFGFLKQIFLDIKKLFGSGRQNHEVNGEFVNDIDRLLNVLDKIETDNTILCEEIKDLKHKIIYNKDKIKKGHLSLNETVKKLIEYAEPHIKVFENYELYKTLLVRAEERGKALDEVMIKNNEIRSIAIEIYKKEKEYKKAEKEKKPKPKKILPDEIKVKSIDVLKLENRQLIKEITNLISHEQDTENLRDAWNRFVRKEKKRLESIESKHEFAEQKEILGCYKKFCNEYLTEKGLKNLVNKTRMYVKPTKKSKLRGKIEMLVVAKTTKKLKSCDVKAPVNILNNAIVELLFNRTEELIGIPENH
ncbi:MAG: hypothetical protein A7315_02260 [Candidatus Altiarchaeales archaeon WOR_SM1_79]|nr:MAG: hypothetical protein A7315_02260 [Candidatus Altiarchaeales archaeon WOR_SM1_79]